MNVQAILNRVNRRLPGYDPSELLDEINDCYQQCWDAICQLDDSYFTDIKTITTATLASEFDFLRNGNGALTTVLSNRYFQIDRIRVLQPADTNFIPASPRPWNDPQLLSISQATPQQVQSRPPYLYTLLGKGSAKFGNLFPVGTQFEIVYTFQFLPLTILSNGTISNAGVVVTGTGSNFTQAVAPDFQGALPIADDDIDIGLELIVTGAQTYQVKSIASDTSLNTFATITPAASGANYQLAMVPDIPDGYHDVLALMATRNAMATPGSDPRLAYFTAQTQQRFDAMRDGIMTRQRQEPPRRRRFPMSVLRYPGVSINR
jgi:hypothetical protein